MPRENGLPRVVKPALPLRLMTYREFLAYQAPEREWLIEDTLPSGSLSLLTGREKSGKSLLTIDAACAIAVGERVWGKSTSRSTVLMLPAEEMMYDLQQRFINRMNGRDDADLHILPPPGVFVDEPDFRITNLDHMNRLAESIRATGAKLVIMDPLREMHDFSENSSDEMAAVMRLPRTLARQLNCALLIVHHMSRAGEARGSTAIKGAVDQEIAWRRLDQHGEKMWEEGTAAEGVMRIEGRYGKKFCRLGFGASGRWQPIESSEPERDAASPNQRGHILNLLRETPSGLTAEEIAQMLDAKLQSIKNTIGTMLTDTDPVIRHEGKGVAGFARRYFTITPEDLFNIAETEEE